jgi:hypothetical protein
MRSLSENVKLTISISPKSDKIIRRQAFNERITISEVFERYQNAYLRELERVKAERRAKKEQAEQSESTIKKESK